MSASFPPAGSPAYSPALSPTVGRGGNGYFADQKVLFAGQSLFDRLFTQASGAAIDAYEAAMAPSFTTFEAVDAAEGATYLIKSNATAGSSTRHWVDDDGTLARGSVYDDRITNGSYDKSAIQIIAWQQGNADRPYIPGTTSKADFRAAMDALIDFFFEDHPNLRYVIINPLGRNTSATTVGPQAIREVHHEICAEDVRCRRGIDVYDFDLVDAVHPTDAENLVFAARLARRHLAIMGKRTAFGTLGPYISSAYYTPDKLVATVTHDGGTDLTGSPWDEDFWGVLDDGTEIVPSAVARIDATTIEFTLPEGATPVAGSTVNLVSGYNSMEDLPQTGIDVPFDDSANTLPLRTGTVTVTNADPIAALSDLVIYLDAHASAKTYSSSNNIATISKLAGSVASATELGTTANAPQYDGAALGGVGGVVVPDADTQLHYGAFTAGETHTFGMVVHIPSTTPDNGVLMGFANVSGGVDNQAKFYLRTTDGGRLVWDLNESDNSIAYPLPFTDSGSHHMLLFEFVNESLLRVYIDDFSEPALNIVPSDSIDPRTDYTAWTYISLFKRAASDSPTGLEMGAYFHTTDVLSEAEKAAIQTFWLDRFDAVLSNANSWAYFATGGVNPKTWADLATGGVNPKTWADLEA